MYQILFLFVCNFNLPAEIDIVMSVTKGKSKLRYRSPTKGCIMQGAVKQIFFLCSTLSEILRFLGSV